MRFYRHRHPETTFDALAHEWLAEPVDGTFLFVRKGTDRPGRYEDLTAFDLVPSPTVPVPVRRLASSRWAAYCRWRKRRGSGPH